MSGAPRYGLVGDVPDPGPRLLELIGYPLVPLSFGDAVRQIRSGELAGAALGGSPSQPELASLAGVDAAAEPSGFLDTLMLAPEGVVGRATLGAGLRQALERTGWDLEDRPALLLGAGLRARAVGASLLLKGTQHLRFAARSLDEGIQAIRCLGGLARKEGALLDFAPLDSIPWEEGWERALVINATPVGLDDPEADPLWRFARLNKQMRVIDLVHRPVRTALLRRAHRSKGLYLAGMAVFAEQALLRATMAGGIDVDASLEERVRRVP